jgi:hypothetical protein
MFPSPNILHHYVEFDIHTIVTLEKLLGAGSFGGSIGHLARRHAILFVFPSGLNLPFVVWIIAFAFLGCWALIAPKFVFHFQQDNHLIFLDVVAHVETNTSSFQIIIRDV